MLLQTTVVVAQRSPSGGLAVFPGSSSITTGEVNSTDSRTAYQAGAMIQFATENRRNALRVGFLYSHTRGDGFLKEPDFVFPGLPTIPGDAYTFRYTHNDLLIPAEFLLDFNKKSGGMYVIAGPALAINLSHKVVRSPAYANPSGARGSALDLWANIGLGYRFKADERSSIYIQPMISGNFPGFILGLASAGNGGDEAPAQVVMYGVYFGLAIE